MHAVADPYERLASVEAELIYLAPGPEKPRTYCYKLPPGVPHSNYALDPRRHRIYDARPIAGDCTLDREGFTLLSYRPREIDFRRQEEIRNTYIPETENFIKSVTGATFVFIFDHTVRHAQSAPQSKGDPARAPVYKVHVDNTHETGLKRVRNVLSERVGSLLDGHIQILNLWRPIRGPLVDSPLALCDARSVWPDQLVPVELVFENVTEETIRATYDAGHRWFYFPDMQADEAILLKTYDSETDGRARFVPHSAFVHPANPPGGLPRESIEVRAVVVYPIEN